MNRKVKKKLDDTLKKTPLLPKVVEFFSRPRVVSYLTISLFLAIVMGSLFFTPQLFDTGFREGDVALHDVYAPYDFTYDWGVDEAATLEAKTAAALEVPEFIHGHEDVPGEVRHSIRGFFKELAVAQGKGREEGKTYLKDKYPGLFSNDEHIEQMLSYTDIETLERTALETASSYHAKGLVDTDALERIEKVQPDRLRLSRREEEEWVDVGSLMSFVTFEAEAGRLMRSAFPGRFALQRAMTELLTGMMRPNFTDAEDYTRRRKIEVFNSVEPVYRTRTVLKNELVIGKGMRIDARNMAALAAMSSAFRSDLTPLFFGGLLLFCALLGLMWWMYARSTDNRIFVDHPKNVAIVLVNMLIMILLANWIIHLPQPSNAIPLAGLGMIVLLMVGFHAAFIAVSIVSMVIALLFGGGIETFFILIVSSFVGMFAVRDARLRVRIIGAGFASAGAQMAAVAAIGLLNDMPLLFFLYEGLWGAAGGVFSAFYVLALMPVFEHLFKAPTNITLVELSDLNHPLLKQLATVAPGTYHHSILVGNLAEAACDAIGANSLSARVGSYYHDIGKLDKPEYFTENEMLEGAKHDKLAPSMSALIITQHVKKGLELAKRYKLNRMITDYIAQHHGNGLISFFYEKALKETNGNGKKLKDQDYRYPGPRPQTKESAIVLMADSVEAATRSLQQPTQPHIQALVQKIINTKFIDGQLDECDLTLRDMHTIQETFVRVLTGMYHKRLQYPDQPSGKKGRNGFSNGSNRFTKP